MNRHLLRTVVLPLALILAGLAVPPGARGYNVDVHRSLSKLAFVRDRAWLDTPVVMPGVEELNQFRLLVYEAARTHPDAELRDRFLKRYPSAEAFDAWAFKELLALHGGAQVVGVDVIAPASTVGELVAEASAQPDTDFRNIGRKAYGVQDGKRVALADRYGQPVPFDPAILNMGRLDQLSSQAHAHYGLAQVELSSDIDVLEKEPRRFAIPFGYPQGPIVTLAAEMAQMHTDLAVFAALSSLPRAAELGWLFGAQGWHYTQDVGNQVHTVQVGLHDFATTAQLQYWKQAALTLGGLWGELRPLPSIGVDILTNHHLLGEDLTRARWLATIEGQPGPAELKLAFETIGDDDEEMAAALAATGATARDPFALSATRALIELSSHEGSEVYRLTRVLVDGRYSDYGVVYDEKAETLQAALREGADESDEAHRFFGLQARGFRRVATALRHWRTRFVEAVEAGRSDPSVAQAAVGRLLRQQLDLLDAAEQRRAEYLRNPPAPATGRVLDWNFILAVAALGLGAVLFLAGLRRRRIRRREARS